MDPAVGWRRGAAAAAVAFLAGGLAVAAQPSLPPVPQAPAPQPPAATATPAPPPAPSMGPVVAPPPEADAEPASQPEDVEAKPLPKPEAEAAGPPRPERSATAIVRVLDKVTAETLRFEAPVGKRVRYKNLVFEVKACETWGVHAPTPRASAYMVISADLGAAAGEALGSHEVYRGWMFAQAPAAHALEHPVYDAWLESCANAASPQA